jgi:hypothetical protein
MKFVSRQENLAAYDGIEKQSLSSSHFDCVSWRITGIELKIAFINPICKK